MLVWYDGFWAQGAQNGGLIELTKTLRCFIGLCLKSYSKKLHR